ncbi:hypothetical protein [Vreelandella neptunia]|uniref:Uncharacterized protein n=1 Tax=Vreelandella neptunia TaxID=115551 RepID=A0ABS9S5I9_9GAMM|nr:hypothetical protein [Halomonas neptunia]MCH4811377.1 hypothetical protein [Halomonas neptunia]
MEWKLTLAITYKPIQISGPAMAGPNFCCLLYVDTNHLLCTYLPTYLPTYLVY